MDTEDTELVLDIDEIEEESEIDRTYKLDFEKGRIIGFVEGAEACAQALKKQLMTPRYACLIYSDDYGSEINDLLRGNVTDALLETEIPALSKDCIIDDERFIKLKDFEFDIPRDRDARYMSFTAETVYGDIGIQEVRL